MPIKIPNPWLDFLREVDAALSGSVVVHCLGGFVLMAAWNYARPTADVDFIDVSPPEASNELLQLAGLGSALAKKHRLHFQRVTVAAYPESYASRLTDITPVPCRSLRLLAFEVHDLVLAKIDRFSPRDREDLMFLARKGVLDLSLLRTRYESEMRQVVLNESRYAQQLDICLDMLAEIAFDNGKPGA
jgi:hypothetical protein